MGHDGTSSPKWHVYKKKFLHTAKCSSLKGHRTTTSELFPFIKHTVLRFQLEKYQQRVSEDGKTQNIFCFLDRTIRLAKTIFETCFRRLE